jgi:hypothetical protein
MRFPIIFLIASGAFAQDANEIIRRATDRDFTNFENRKNYTYQERTELREYNTKGRQTKTDVQTVEVLILEGQPYEKLIARNDRPLSEKDAQKEHSKLDREVEKRKRQSVADKAKLDKERLEEKKYLREFTEVQDRRRGAGERQAGLGHFGDAKAGLSAEGIRRQGIHKIAGQSLDRQSRVSLGESGGRGDRYTLLRVFPIPSGPGSYGQL